MKEAVTAAEVLGNLRGELFVQGVGGLPGGGYLESRRVHEHPKPDEHPEGLGEHLDGSVLRAAGVRDIVAMEINNHLDEDMHRHYSTVSEAEKSEAVAAVIDLAGYREAMGR